MLSAADAFIEENGLDIAFQDIIEQEGFRRNMSFKIEIYLLAIQFQTEYRLKIGSNGKKVRIQLRHKSTLAYLL